MNFEQNILFGISSKKYLSELLNLDKNKLRSVSENFIPKSFIAEKNGKSREFFDQTHEHKQALKKLVKYLSRLDIPDYMTGGVSGRSYVSNVEIHKANKYAIILDVSNFFPSTNGNKVYKLFKNDFNQANDIAKILRDLTTVEKQEKCFLPQGYPTSPILSFLAYHQMYEKLANYAKVHNLCFSAYYDDLTFSSKSKISEKWMFEIEKIIESYSLGLNQKKSKLTKLDYTKITGCVIVNGELKAPRRLQKETHDMFDYLGKAKLSTFSKDELSKMLQKFRGKILSIQMIEKDRKFPNYEKLILDIKKRIENDSDEFLLQVQRVDKQSPKYGWKFYNHGNLNNIPEDTSMVFSKTPLTFYLLKPYKDILDDGHMQRLLDFGEEVRENNDAIKSFGASIFNTPFQKYPDKMSEISEIYYSLFQYLGLNKQPNFSDTEQQAMKASFGTLHDYRNARNHSPLDRGWVYPKGTELKNIAITQQEAIHELFAMLEFAKKQ